MRILSTWLLLSFVLVQPPAYALRGPQSEKVRAGLEEQLTQAGMEERFVTLETLRSPASSWQKIFDNSLPVEWEIGFAPGWELKKRAIDDPEKNFLGIEDSWKGLEDFDPNAFPPNVKFVMADVREVVSGLSWGLGSVDRILFQFPPSDPDPERGSYLFHPDRRLPGQLFRLIAPSGRLEVWTESPGVADLFLEAAREHALHSAVRLKEIPTDSPEYPQTPDGRRFQGQGLPAWHIGLNMRDTFRAVASSLKGPSAGLRQLASELNDVESRVFRPTHPATLLMLEAMEKLGPIFQDAEVVDVGTGSGILILAALKHLGARHGTATDIDDLEVSQARRHAERLGIPADRVVTLKGDLFDPVQGRQFDVTLFNAPGTGLAKAYLAEVGGVLRPQGVGLLMWNARLEDDLVRIAHKEGIWLAPILEGPSDWTIYAVTHSLERLQMISSMVSPPSPGPDATGMEEQVPVVEQPKVLDTFDGGFSPAGRRWLLDRPREFRWVTDDLLALLHGRRVRLLQHWPDREQFLWSHVEVVADLADPSTLLLLVPTLESLTFNLLVWTWDTLSSYNLVLNRKPGPTPSLVDSTFVGTRHMKGLGKPHAAVFDRAGRHALFLGVDRRDVRTKGVHYALWEPLTEDKTAAFKTLRDPGYLAEDTSRGWVWAVERPRPGEAALVAFRWDEESSRYDRLGRIPLPSGWAFHTRIAVEPVSGELVVSSPDSQQILVLRPRVRGEQVLGADPQKIIHLPVIYEELDHAHPIPITFHAPTRRILVGDPYGRQVWVLAPLSEQESGELTLFDLIARDKLPPPAQKLFWNPAGFRFSEGRLVVWDKGQAHFVAGELPADGLRAASEVPLDGIEWGRAADRSKQSPLFDRFSLEAEREGRPVRWEASVRKEEFLTGTELRLTVRYRAETEEASQEFRDELVPSEDVRGPEGDRRIVAKDSDVWLAGHLEQDGSLRLTLLIQDLSGWKPFSWEARVLFQEGRLKIPAGQFFWHRLSDRYLLGVGTDPSGRAWAIRWKPYKDDDGSQTLPALVPLPTDLPLSGAAMAGMEEALHHLPRFAHSVRTEEEIDLKAEGRLYLVERPTTVGIQGLLKKRTREYGIFGFLVDGIPFLAAEVGSRVDVGNSFSNFVEQLSAKNPKVSLEVLFDIHNHPRTSAFPSNQDFLGRFVGYLGTRRSVIQAKRYFVYGPRTGRLIEFGDEEPKSGSTYKPRPIRLKIWRMDGQRSFDHKFVGTENASLTAWRHFRDERSAWSKLFSASSGLKGTVKVEVSDFTHRWVRWNNQDTLASVLEKGGFVQPAGAEEVELRPDVEAEMEEVGWLWRHTLDSLRLDPANHQTVSNGVHRFLNRLAENRIDVHFVLINGLPDGLRALKSAFPDQTEQIVRYFLAAVGMADAAVTQWIQIAQPGETVYQDPANLLQLGIPLALDADWKAYQAKLKAIGRMAVAVERQGGRDYDEILGDYNKSYGKANRPTRALAHDMVRLAYSPTEKENREKVTSAIGHLSRSRKLLERGWYLEQRGGETLLVAKIRLGPEQLKLFLSEALSVPRNFPADRNQHRVIPVPGASSVVMEQGKEGDIALWDAAVVDKETARQLTPQWMPAVRITRKLSRQLEFWLLPVLAEAALQSGQVLDFGLVNYVEDKGEVWAVLRSV